MYGNFKTRTICIIMSAAVLATLSGCFKLEIKNKETETSISTVLREIRLKFQKSPFRILIIYREILLIPQKTTI